MLKVSLMIAMFCSFAMADGDMGNGRGCTGENCPQPPCTEYCGGGSAMQSNETEASSESSEYFLEIIDTVERNLFFTF